MVKRTTGTVKAAASQSRRVMSRSSGFSSSVSPRAVRGSSAIPQIGHEPGSSRTISGCIGQVHSVRAAGAGGVTGSSPIPHVGQLPGPVWRTSGCMGQVCWVPGVGRAWLGMSFLVTSGPLLPSPKTTS